MKESTKNWTKFNLEKGNGNYPSWPIEVMVKVLFGNYLNGKKPTVNESTKILDVGCGFGNNLLPFLVMGAECYGVEISQEMANLAEKILRQRGFENVNISVGSNKDLDFPDETFDVIVSNNVIHYENNEADIQRAINEYFRVLRKGGCLYIMTVGPEHDIYRRSEIIGLNQFKIKNWDFRDGETYFYFSDSKQLEYHLSRVFSSIEIGRVRENLMKTNLDFFIAYCRK